MEALTQARLVVHWQDKPEESIAFKYNPTDITFDKGVQIAEIAIPGLDTPLLQFVRGQNEKLTMDLFFDTTEDGMGVGATSVTKYTDKILSLVKIEPGRHAPPICTFHWNPKFPGSNLSDALGNQLRNAFTCVVESVKQKFTLFSPEGVPLRATLSVSVREYKTLDQQLKELNLNSPDRQRVHIVQEGETLSGIAARYYSKPGEWRLIAEANDIEDPRRVEPARLLVVPAIE